MRKSEYRTPEGKYRCPHCGGLDENDTPVEFDTLYYLKKHMTEAHGGFAPADVEGAVAESRTPEGEQPPAEPTQPRRISKRSRELNDKVNEAIQLGLNHLLKGNTEEESARLSALRGEISAACMGVEFDFENTKLVRVGGRFGLILLMVFLWFVPYAPTVKTLFVQMHQRQAGQAPEPEPQPDEPKVN